MLSFITNPIKTTTPVDWSEALSHFLTSTFGRSFTEEITPSIKQLNKLRKDVQHASQENGALSIHQMLDYITQLDSLTLRIPIDIMLSSSNLEFEWSSTTKSSGKKEMIKQSSIAFEKACVLFNIACLYAGIATSSASLLDWKVAIAQFANSSGTFQYISDHFLHAPCDDLQVDLIKSMSKLMIAQAQECFLWNYMQSTTTTVKHSLVARLSEGVSQSYGKHVKLHPKEGGNVRGDLHKEVSFKIPYFHSFAYLHYAQMYMEENKVGIAIRCLEIAMDVWKGWKVSTRKLDAVSNRLYLEISGDINEKLEVYNKDNDLIYHQTVPIETDVPTIKAMEGSKATDFEKMLKAASCEDLFVKIIPMEAHQSMSIYSEKQADVLRYYSEKVQVADEEIRSVFEFSRLPKCLVEVSRLLKDGNETQREEEREHESEYPRVLAMSHEMSSGRGSDFPQTLQIIKEKRDFINRKIEFAEEQFVRDEKNVLVRGLAEHAELLKLKDEVVKVRRTLTEAGASDSRLNNFWSKFEVEIAVLKEGTAGVQQWLDSPSDSDADGISKQVSLLDIDDSENENDEFEKRAANVLIDNVYSMKKRLETLMDQRDTILSDLKQDMHSEDISSVLIKHGGASNAELNKVFDEQLQKYTNYTSKLDELTTVQEERIIELKDTLNRLLDLNIIKKKNQEKKKELNTMKSKLGRLINAYETWKLCTKGSSEAAAFYTKLVDRTVVLTNRIQDIVNQREASVSGGSVGLRNDSIHSVSTGGFTGTGGFGGYTVNNVPPPPQYSSNPTGNNPPLPAKPSYAGQPHNQGSQGNQPYTTPSVYDPNMYSQFGQNYRS
jgi:hypothetical protein